MPLQPIESPTRDTLEEALDAWRPGATRDAIVDFLLKATTGLTAVPSQLRIAAFDYDGTIACERPHTTFGAFLEGTGLGRPTSSARGAVGSGVLRALAQKLPFQGTKALEQAAMLVRERTVQDYEDDVIEFLQASRHPRFGRHWYSLGYAPMTQLMDVLRRLDFSVFIVSAGSRDLLRAFTGEAFGLRRENVIGTEIDIEWQKGKLLRTAGMIPLDMGARKPAHLWDQAGVTALFAAGNTADDRQLLDSASFALLINHDDAEREYDYTDDKALDDARKGGWTVASVRDDFATVFGPDRELSLTPVRLATDW